MPNGTCIPNVRKILKQFFIVFLARNIKNITFTPEMYENLSKSTMNKHRFLFSGLLLWFLLFCLTAYSQDNTITLRILTYNIRHGAGMDDVIDLDRQATAIKRANANVIGLQEVDSCVKRSGYIPEAAVLAEKLGMHSTFGGAIPLTGGKYGVAILSKEEPLTVHHIPLPGTEKRTLLVCEFEDYVFATTHLDLDEECRLASLPIIFEEAQSWDKPFFICGDWNDLPTSNLISTMEEEGFVMLNYRKISSGVSSTYYTFPAKSPTKLIDYIAIRDNVNYSVSLRRVINEPKASDHRPVLVVVAIPSYATGTQASSADGDGNMNEEIYDLSGKRVLGDKLAPGLYIEKNRKRVVCVK